jgi:hypothetical protein
MVKLLAREYPESATRSVKVSGVPVPMGYFLVSQVKLERMVLRRSLMIIVFNTQGVTVL